MMCFPIDCPRNKLFENPRQPLTCRAHGFRQRASRTSLPPKALFLYGHEESQMKTKRIAVGSFAVVLMIAAISVFAQINRPYHNGSVWNIAFIRIKPGMDTAYMNYLAGSWKAEQEAQKKDGNIVSYKVMSVEGHTTGEFNLMLMTEYKNLATMEANEDKAEAVAQKVVGNDEVQMKGYNDRLAIREVIGDRLAREVIPAPKWR